MVKEVELQAWEWMIKFNEKFRLLQLKINDHDNKGLTEDDESLLRVLFKIWNNGEFPLYTSKMEGIVETSVQTNLFSAISSEEYPTFDDERDKMINGKIIEYPLTEPKTEKRNVTKKI
jgi:hypothetical protein